MQGLSRCSVRITYCGNNPVTRADDGGQFWNFVVGAVVGAVVSAVTTAIDAVQEGGLSALADGETWAKISVSAATGAVGGVVAASGVGLGAAVAWGAGTAAVESIGHQVIDTGSVDVSKLLVDTAEGAIGGLIGGKGAINGNKYMNRQVSRLLTHRKTDGLKNALKFGWKMTKNYSKQFVLPTVWGITKSFAGGKIAEAAIE